MTAALPRPFPREELTRDPVELFGPFHPESGPGSRQGGVGRPGPEPGSVRPRVPYGRAGVAPRGGPLLGRRGPRRRGRPPRPLVLGRRFLRVAPKSFIRLGDYRQVFAADSIVGLRDVQAINLSCPRATRPPRAAAEVTAVLDPRSLCSASRWSCLTRSRDTPSSSANSLKVAGSPPSTP